MMTFGKILGELAGHDIELWRDAGLDPNGRGPVRDRHEAAAGIGAGAVVWVKRICGGLAAWLADRPVLPRPSELLVRPVNVHCRACPVEKG